MKIILLLLHILLMMNQPLLANIESNTPPKVITTINLQLLRDQKWMMGTRLSDHIPFLVTLDLSNGSDSEQVTLTSWNIMVPGPDSGFDKLEGGPPAISHRIGMIQAMLREIGATATCLQEARRMDFASSHTQAFPSTELPSNRIEIGKAGLYKETADIPKDPQDQNLGRFSSGLYMSHTNQVDITPLMNLPALNTLLSTYPPINNNALVVKVTLRKSGTSFYLFNVHLKTTKEPAADRAALVQLLNNLRTHEIFPERLPIVLIGDMNRDLLSLDLQKDIPDIKTAVSPLGSVGKDPAGIGLYKIKTKDGIIVLNPL